MSEINNDRRFRISVRNVLHRVAGFPAKAGFRRERRGTVVAGIALLGSIFAAMGAARGEQIPFLSFIYNGVFFPNPNGASQTYNTNGRGIDLKGPFFQSMGTNGRSCGTCHQPGDGMAVSAASVQRRFLVSKGLDPIFRPVDGSNCNHNIDVSTLAGRSAGPGQRR